jgi:hypothetical protein
MEKDKARKRTERIQAFRNKLETIDWDTFPDLDEQNRDRLVAYRQRMTADLARRCGVPAGDGRCGKGISTRLCILGALGILTLFAAVYCFYSADLVASQRLWLAFCP